MGKRGCNTIYTEGKGRCAGRVINGVSHHRIVRLKAQDTGRGEKCTAVSMG